MLKIYRNTAIFIFLIMIGIQWGFYQSYTSEFPNFVNKTTTMHIHGVVLMMWMVLLIVQPLLIHTGRQKLHRTIGNVSYVLGPLVIVYMFLIGRSAYWRAMPVVTEQENLATMVLDVRGLLFFALFWALAMYYRKQSDAHMRYMIATGILAIGPGVGRGLMHSFNIDFINAIYITDLLDLAIVGFLLGYDIYKKKNYKPFLLVFSVLLFGAVLWYIRDSAAWLSFAKFYVNTFY